MKAQLVLPSALVQFSEILRTIAPAKLAGVVTISADGSLVCTVQLPSAFLVPSLRAQSEGIPLTVSEVTAPIPDGSSSPRLIGLAEIPAGARLVIRGVVIFVGTARFPVSPASVSWTPVLFTKLRP